MNKQIPQDKLDFLNDLLDKELEILSQPISTNFWQGSNQKEESLIVEKELFVQGKFDTKSSQMQQDLVSLQSKLLNLEKKITTQQFDSNPLKNQYISPQLNQQILSDSVDDNTPMKNMYDEPPQRQNSSTKRTIKFSQDIPTKQHKRQTSQKNFSPQSQLQQRVVKERVNKFELERSIEEAEVKLHQSKSSFKRSRNDSSKRSSSTIRSNSHNHSEMNNDVQSLNKKIQSMRKAQEEERNVLQKERQKNQKLLQDIIALNKEVKKSSFQTDKNSQLESDYRRLLENFEKSEYIRLQQKNLIHNLKLEIENLKRPNQEPLRESKNIQNQNLSGVQQPPKKKKK